MPSKLNSPLLLFSDFSPRFWDQVLLFFNRRAWKLSFGHFSHIQGKVHVKLFKLNPTCLPFHSCRHVNNLQEISYCIYIWDWAITSTRYPSVASCRVVQVTFVPYWGRVSLDSLATISKLTTSWPSILQTAGTHALVDNGRFPLQAAINWSRSSWCAPAV